MADIGEARLSLSTPRSVSNQTRGDPNPTHKAAKKLTAFDHRAPSNRATQHKAPADYSDQPRIVRRVTIEGPVSVGIDGPARQKTQL
jgi:hypothetical protein